MKGSLVALASVGSIYSTIVIGSIVTALEAGLACGTDWPTCNEQVIPSDLLVSAEVFFEYVHRVVAALSGLLVLATLIVSLRNDAYSGPRRWAILTFIALMIQILLGREVVARMLNPYLVAAHLSLAVTVLLLATITAYSMYKADKLVQPQKTH
ncbi:MAG: COX15/CtaA family protein [Desulfurococcales archaeon]|nr:COX15/CtaA family protein [Desulfurococcales archaeon]